MAVKWFKGLYRLNIKGEEEKYTDLRFQSILDFRECHVGS